MMKCSRIAALLLCALMLMTVTACKPNTNLTPTPAPAPPQAVEATDSKLIGTWAVSGDDINFDTLTFFESGSVQCKSGLTSIGGLFTDDGTTLTLTISQQTLAGTYTIDGNTVTFVTPDKTLVLTKQ